METLDKAWHTAADTLKSEIHAYQSSNKQWTEYAKEEPLSGIQGKGTATDPYDAGNRDEQPGAPNSQQNTALVPEALVSTADDDVKKTGRAAPVTNGSLGTRSDSFPTGNKFVGVMDAPEQRTQPPPPSLTTPTTGRASFVTGLDGRDSVAATAAGGSGTNGVKEEKKEESSLARARMPQTQQKSQNPITSSRRFNQTPNGVGMSGEDSQKPPSKVTSTNDQSATVPPSTLGSQTSTTQNDDSRRLSLQKDKYTGAEMSKRQSLLGSNPQAGAAATDGTDYINTHAAGLSISGTPGAEPNRPAAVSKASEEALKGPQCSAKPPYDFEKQLDETNGRRKSRSSHKKSNSTGDANASKPAEKTPSSEESAKSSSKNSRNSTMAHMKEKIEKVVHRGNHSNK